MLGRFARRTALAGAVAYGVYSAGIRPWKHRWDASPDERGAILPGDDLVPTPQLEALALGAKAPAPPPGGVKVVGLEHECVLVLYMDATLAQERASLPEFSVSWTFVLQPLPSSRTRL